MSATRSEMLLRDSRLRRDLYLDHRDAMYRAMTFIARRGGPHLPGQTKEDLVTHRQEACDWLLAQEDPGELLDEYDHFWQSWSPIFPDYEDPEQEKAPTP